MRGSSQGTLLCGAPSLLARLLHWQQYVAVAAKRLRTLPATHQPQRKGRARGGVSTPVQGKGRGAAPPPPTSRNGSGERGKLAPSHSLHPQSKTQGACTGGWVGGWWVGGGYAGSHQWWAAASTNHVQVRLPAGAHGVGRVVVQTHQQGGTTRVKSLAVAAGLQATQRTGTGDGAHRIGNSQQGGTQDEDTKGGLRGGSGGGGGEWR